MKEFPDKTPVKERYEYQHDGWMVALNVGRPTPDNKYWVGLTIRRMPDGRLFGKPGLCSKEFLEDYSAVNCFLIAKLEKLKRKYLTAE